LAALSDLDEPRWTRPEVGSASVLVLEADPDLGSVIDKVQWQLAVAASVAPAFELERGPWRFAPRPDAGALGALVLEGLIVIRINAETRAHIELLGPGDVIGPWVGSGQELTLPSVPTTSVVSKARIALLDRRFALRTARWPEIHAALMHRLIVRTRRLSLQSAINALSRIEERLEVTLWELAYRFGKVTPDGIMLDLPLTHSQMAEMVAAQRPSVSTAFTRLQDHGRIVHAARHRWLLLGEPPSTLSSLAQQTGLAP
jgi:CRP/FNR family transcriptional regulator, cyclic AMP receptor protein